MLRSAKKSTIDPSSVSIVEEKTTKQKNAKMRQGVPCAERAAIRQERPNVKSSELL